MHQSLEATLERLKQERDEADRRYNEALTALDRGQLRHPAFPPPPAAYDEHQLAALNDSWNILPAPPSRGGVRGRLTRFVWGVVAPYFERQLRFNSGLVDHLNRNVAAHRDAARAADATVALLRQQTDALVQFQSLLIRYLQQITAYVDTKDRDIGGQALVINAAVNGVSEDVARRWESMAARERRSDAKVAAIAAAHDELRTAVGIAQQAALTAKRELERILAGGARPDDDAAPDAPDRRAGAGRHGAPALNAFKYVGFEDRFRGSQDAIRARLESYVPYFDGAADVLDVGCGRGEFLDLLQSRGVRARGLDLNHEMVEVCRARGLDVIEADVVSYLAGLPDRSLGGLFAAQVVEHVQPADLVEWLELARHKLRPGARLVLETLNPACWVAFFDSFIRDITHVWPLHPDTLRYLVQASGFTRAEIEYRSPVAPEDRLQTIAAPAGTDDGLAAIVETFNANVERLNGRMFTYLDYAIVASY